jgi:hypothetical protein
MFMLNSHPATVLFDSGASHSFVAAKFVATHSLPIADMRCTMLITSPGGNLSTKRICPSVSLNIRGVAFLANLIILESQGIDIILGMNWMKKHDGIIHCARRAVQLTSLEGQHVEFVAAPMKSGAVILNHAKGQTLVEIKVVQDFPDVFPARYAAGPRDRVYH